MDPISSQPACFTSTLKNRLLTECKDFLEKFACKVFVIVSEDGLSSQYIGSQDFVREFLTTGLKVKPGDVNVGLCPTATVQSTDGHIMGVPSEETYEDSKNLNNLVKKEDVFLEEYTSSFDLANAPTHLHNDVINIAVDKSRSGELAIEEESAEIGNKLTEAEVMDDMRNTGEPDNDVLKFDEECTETVRESGSSEDNQQREMEVEETKCIGTLKNQEKSNQIYPIALRQNIREMVSASIDASPSAFERSYDENGDITIDETNNEDNSSDADTNQINTLVESCNGSSKNGNEKPKFKRKKHEREGKLMMTDEGLEIHKERIRKAMIDDKPYTCEKCGKGYKQQQGLSLHMSLGVCVRQKCKYCGLEFLLKDWQKHMVDSHAEEIPVFPCNYCDRTFINCATRSNHILSKHSNDVFECDVCKRVFSYRSALTKHKRIHSERKFDCRYCDMKFTTEGIRSTHEKELHSEVSAVCTVCEEKFDTRAKMANHLRTAHIKPGFKCSFCNKKFHSMVGWKAHLETHGLLSSKYSCKICKKVFYIKSEYRKHRYRDCTKPEYLCDICGRQFKKGANLRLHASTHSEPTIKCDLCPRVFKLQTTLTAHIKSVHSDERPWKCNVCGYRCKLRENLLKHTRIHNK
ncbi:zinc finger protein 320-like isoform X1 [Ptychodera flava]|uniref:zinc finger protein 320-like isoform X1 n=2 Tax=Ptychodera flava TaxID=63121 RepID=UPI00396A955A